MSDPNIFSTSATSRLHFVPHIIQLFCWNLIHKYLFAMHAIGNPKSTQLLSTPVSQEVALFLDQLQRYRWLW